MTFKIDSGPRGFRVPKTAELVAKQLRNKIIRNELPDGHSLPSETELSRSIRSASTLREAIRILESEGLGRLPAVFIADPGYTSPTRDWPPSISVACCRIAARLSVTSSPRAC